MALDIDKSKVTKEVNKLIEEYKETGYAEGDWDRLVELGESAVEPIIETMTEEGGWFDAEAAGALVKIGDLRAVAPLLRLYEEGEKDVIKPLLDILKKINEKKTIKGIMVNINHVEAILDEDISMADLYAIREYSRDQAANWWSRGMKKEAICDACNSVVRYNSGSIVGSWLRCDKCSQELFSESTLNDLREQPNYFGRDILAKSREFYIRKMMDDIKNNKKIKKILKKGK